MPPKKKKAPARAKSRPAARKRPAAAQGRVLRASARASTTKPAGRPDRWVKCVVSNGNIRAVAIEATGILRDLVKRHKLSPIGARGLGEALVSAALVASSCKGKERVNLNIQGDGEFSQALVDASADGTVRGYIIERKKKKTRSESVGPWGEGMLSVLRTKGPGEPPYIGTVPLVTGHLAKDLTFYWFQSEQIPSAVGLGVTVERNQVIAAGGFLVQAMPGADDHEVRLIQRHIASISDLKTIITESDPVRLLSQIFDEHEFSIVEEKPLVFKCQCSVDRVERSLALIGAKELRSILKKDGKALVTCDFCSTEYVIKGPALRRLITASSPVR